MGRSGTAQEPMPSRSRPLRALLGLVLCSGLAGAASAAPPELRDHGTLWEEQVRAELRRSIAEREQAAWRASQPRTPPAPRQAAAPEARASSPSPRRFSQSPYAPLAAREDRVERAGEWLTLTFRDIREDLARMLDSAPTGRLAAPDPALRLPGAVAIAPPSPPNPDEPARLPRGNANAPELEATLASVSAAPLDAPERVQPPRRLLIHPDLLATLLTAAAALAALALVLEPRRRGDLAIQVAYPLELRGSFTVRIDTALSRAKRRHAQSDIEVLEAGGGSAREHQLVARETSFRQLRARRYYVTIDGVLQDPRDGSVVAHPFLQAAATVLPRRTVRLDLDATPGACPVDVRVVWDGAEVVDARVAARGHMSGSVETILGHVRLNLPRGTYRIVAGGVDRVVEQEISVESHLPTQLEVDLALRENTVFKACPPAVEPYLAGQLEIAAQELTREGQAEQAHRLLGQRSRDRGRNDEAALHFEAAGALELAAEIQAELRNYSHAGELFERSHDLISAAEMYQLSGHEARAGQAYEAARDFENAIACYRSAGEIASWVDILDRQGQLYVAACAALDNDLPTRGIRLLHRVSAEDPNYQNACLRLADTFERESHFDLAARKLADHLEAGDPEAIEPALYSRLAELHHKAGDVESALDVLETLRMLEPAYPNLAARTEELRKARSAQRLIDENHLQDEASMPQTVILANQRYEQLEELGRGGMGVVYKARDRRLGRVVALKRLSEGLREHPRAAELFLREARAAAALNHPNIVTVHDADLEDGVLFITMELLDGNPLHQVLRQHGPMTSDQVARIGRQVCAGLEYAHMRGIIHRDIKTANLFLTNDRRTKIMDFGLARVTEEARRNASLLGGTPNYMAPEQANGDGGDHRADLYALGATLFELTTGAIPFAHPDETGRGNALNPPDAREQVPATDPRLAHVIRELLAVEPSERPASAAAVGLRLAAISADTPVP